MRANKSRDTRPELAVRRAAHALGLRYRVSVRPVPSLRRTADLVFTRAKVAVFVDGCFWHGCPEHHTVAVTNAGYWAAKVIRNRDRDAETTRLLEEAGWISLRFWEHEDPAMAAEAIRQTVVTARQALKSENVTSVSQGRLGPTG
jgi:DNA mismatch endonuclease (patch repair protein)